MAEIKSQKMDPTHELILKFLEEHNIPVIESNEGYSGNLNITVKNQLDSISVFELFNELSKGKNLTLQYNTTALDCNADEWHTAKGVNSRYEIEITNARDLPAAFPEVLQEMIDAIHKKGSMKPS